MSSYADSSECVELHVLYVPEEQWNSRLNKISVAAVENFISAGFIRVYSNMSLKALREELTALLGAEKAVEKFCFLKCVGRSLALVKAKQERELRVSSFAPPNAPYPELYLLPSVDSSSNVCSHSLTTPDTLSSNTDPQTYYLPKALFAPGPTKEPTKFPLIKQVPQRSPPPPQSLDDEGSSSSQGEREDDSLSCENSEWREARRYSRGFQEQKKSVIKTKSKDAAVSPVKHPTPSKESTGGEQHCFNRNCTRDSGIPESLGDQSSGHSLDQNRKSKNCHTLKVTRKRSEDEVSGSAPTSPVAACFGFPTNAPSELLPVRKQATAILPTNRDELIAEIKIAKEERKQLERTRQELLRKGKELLALNRHHRNQARDRWKRRYFETKKATAPLEETLRGLRQELETFYNKLLQQLQARDGRNKQKRLGKLSSTKNELIIQILTESCEIDNLRKNLEDAKMKLATEIKLRKQAATELRALKAELMQKKTQTSLSGPVADSPDLGPERG